MKYILLFLLCIVSCLGAMERYSNHLTIDKSVLLKFKKMTTEKSQKYVEKRGGIKKLNESELEGFVRKRGGYAGLNCDELKQVTSRKFVLHPDWKEKFYDARDQRLKRQKEKKLAAMKLWTKLQVVEYVESKKGEKIDCDELNILNDILEMQEGSALGDSQKKNQNCQQEQNQLTGSKKKLLQEKFVKRPAAIGARWPHVDFSTYNLDDLEGYIQSYDITEVEAEFIAQRQIELRRLECIDTWDYSQAMEFINNMINKDVITYEQWKKISCTVGLPLVTLKPLIRPMSESQRQDYIDAHNKELQHMLETKAHNQQSKDILDCSNA